MKSAPVHPLTPRRSAWKRRGALFGASVALGAVLLAVSGRAIQHFSLFPATPIAPPQNPAREAKRNRSLSAALAKIDAKTVQAYIERWSNPEQKAVASAGRTVYINAELLARRHPAWRLANDLEKGSVAPSNPRIARVLQAGQLELGAKPGLTAQTPQLAALATGVVPGLVLSRSDSPIPAMRRQKDTLDRFLEASAERDATRARDEAFLARRALEEATELARRGAVSEVDLPLLPPDVALELLNLRLELLRNLSRTPAQRAAAREAIRAIETRYAAILNQQTEAQNARLRAATIDLPARARREGLLQIEQASRNTAQAGAQARRALALETEALLNRDFVPKGDLRLALPPLRPLRISGSGPAAALILPTGAAPQIFETELGAVASKAPLETEIRGSGAFGTLATRLRQKARLDAAQWARQCAGHLGATWTSNPKASDATSRALELLFP